MNTTLCGPSMPVVAGTTRLFTFAGLICAAWEVRPEVRTARYFDPQGTDTS